MNNAYSICITCEAQFKPKKGKSNNFCSIPCYRVHQRSGAYKSGSNRKHTCKECGSQVVGKSLSTKRDGTKSNDIFCNRICYDEHRRKIKDNNFKNCAYCDKKLGFKESHNYNTKYCDNTCRLEDKKSKDRNCIHCGVWFSSLKWNTTIKRLVADNARKTCSTECYINNIKENKERKAKISKAFTAEKHPNWQGGLHACRSGFRGADWKNVRLKAIKRDGFKCVDCGINREDHFEKYGCDFNVNHIKPFFQFGGNTALANKLSNLETLCKSCHTKADWKYRKENQMQLGLGL